MNAQQPILVKTDQAHLEIDVEYAKAVLERFSNPWHHYLLTLYLDATAEALQNSIATPPAMTGARCDFGRGGGARELTPDEIGQFHFVETDFFDKREKADQFLVRAIS